MSLVYPASRDRSKLPGKPPKRAHQHVSFLRSLRKICIGVERWNLPDPPDGLSSGSKITDTKTKKEHGKLPAEPTCI